jgi:hypothetical protein
MAIHVERCQPAVDLSREPLAEFPTPKVSKNNQYILVTIIVYVVV